LEVVPAKNFKEYYSMDGANRMSTSCMALRPTHPKFKTMVVRPRDHPLMVVFKGPMPTSNARCQEAMDAGRPALQEFRCMWQCMHFFPWRYREDLRNDNETWEDALSRLVAGRAAYYHDMLDIPEGDAEDMADRHQADMLAFMSNMDIRLQAVDMDEDGVLERMRMAVEEQHALNAETADNTVEAADDTEAMGYTND
jgi:hypothetical protein